MERYEIQKLIDLPIEGVALRLGLKVKRHVSLCPFHEDQRPSLHFNPAKKRYRCYVCGAYGRTIDLVMNFLNLNFVDACKWLADENNIILTEYKAKEKSLTPKPSPLTLEHFAQMVAQPVLTDEAKRFLFDERKLDPRVIQWCGISSTHTHLLIPYYGVDGSLQSIQWRYLGKYANPQLPDEPRFKFPKGSQCHVYNLQILKMLKEGEPLYVTEGASDCWAMLSSGRKAIAIPSATMLKPEDLKPLELWSSKHGTPINLHMFPDDDSPGERLFLMLREHSPNVMRHQLPQGCKDFAEYWMNQKC